MKDFLHDINFTTDFSQSKATALEIAHFLEKLDDLVKEDARLKVVDGCFGFYYPDDVESGIEDNRAELLSILSLSSSMNFKALINDWFNDKSSKYYQLISQFNGLKINIHCFETCQAENQRTIYNCDILITPTGVTFLKSSEHFTRTEKEDLVAIELGHFTTSFLDINGNYHDFSEPLPNEPLSDKYKALKNTTDWIKNSSKEEFLSTRPK